MGKHHAQYAVIVRPNFSCPEIMHGMPYADEDTAKNEARRIRWAGNYSARVAPINPATGGEISPNLPEHVCEAVYCHTCEAHDYNATPPLA